jgi:hypothetical protein
MLQKLSGKQPGKSKAGEEDSLFMPRPGGKNPAESLPPLKKQPHSCLIIRTYYCNFRPETK